MPVEIIERSLQRGLAKKQFPMKSPVTVFDQESGKILSGSIDLLLRDGDCYCIVDYKTAAKIDEADRAIYAKQMQLYSKAIQPPVGARLLLKLCLLQQGKLVDI